MVRAPHTFQGEDLDVLAEYIYAAPTSRAVAHEVDPRPDISAQEDRATGDYNAVWDARNYMNDATKVHAAVLVAHGNNDFNVMTRNAAQFYEALKAHGVPHQLYFHSGGHGGAPPDAMLNRWFTHYLWRRQRRRERAEVVGRPRGDDLPAARRPRSTATSRTPTTLTVADTSALKVGNTLTIPQTNSTGTITTTTRGRSPPSPTPRMSCSQLRSPPPRASAS